MKSFQSVFPYNQTVIAEYNLLNEKQVDEKLAISEIMFATWRLKKVSEKAKLFNNVASLLRERKEALAILITNEMGKLLKESVAEVEKCALGCEYYAENAEAFLKDEIIKTNYKKSFVAFEPIGAVLAIMPWNFPFWQVFRFAVPTLMAGNVALLKHAPNVSGCSLAIENLFTEAGFEKGIFQSLVVDTDIIEKILRSDIVQAVSVTGSEKAGSAVASIASAYIKKSVLELGGADAFIVLDDADIKKAAATALAARMQNAGQSCIAAKRFFITGKIFDDFVDEVKQQITILKPGNPFEINTTFAPMARLDLAEKLQLQMKNSVKKGAEIIMGGKVDGCNFQPTLLLNVQPGMPAFDDETFGPLFSVTKVKDEAEAICLANTSRYGLGGSIWSRDTNKATELARQINSGSVFINSMVKSEPALPFGGVKKSGYGRELSRHGIMEFVNMKTITVAE